MNKLASLGLTVYALVGAAVFNRTVKRATRVEHRVVEDPESTGYYLMAGGSGGSTVERVPLAEVAAVIEAGVTDEDIAAFQRLLAQAEGRPYIPNPED